LFAQSAAALRGEPIPADPTLEEERRLLLHHFRLVTERFGEARAAVLMRKFACCYAQGRPGAREFRKHVVSIDTAEQFYDVVERYFPRDAALGEESAAEVEPAIA
jgi:tRNA-dihydrouridine synthase B